MSSITVLDGSGGAHVHSGSARLADADGGLDDDMDLPAGDAIFVAPGDEIYVDTDAGFLTGHGTQLVGDRLLATLCGVVTRVNKLVSVRPVNSRYTAETGDVVVGRVTEISGKRWKVDVNSRQDAVLMLSAVTLPGNAQRRRTDVDELKMRTLFEEGDLIAAEVQSLFSDGGVALHTRSTRYGRLGRGQLVKVPTSLVPRQKHHCVALPTHGVAVILGCNGHIWVHAPEGAPGGGAGSGGDAAGPGGDTPMDGDDGDAPQPEPEAAAQNTPVDPELRLCICRIAAATRALAAMMAPVTPKALADVADAAVTWGVHPRDMVAPAFLERLAQRHGETDA